MSASSQYNKGYTVASFCLFSLLAGFHLFVACLLSNVHLRCPIPKRSNNDFVKAFHSLAREHLTKTAGGLFTPCWRHAEEQKQLVDEASRFHLGRQRQHSAVICSGALLFSSRVLCPIVESCPLTKLNGGLSGLHSADEHAVLWLTCYGS